MSLQELFIQANEELRMVLMKVQDSQWELMIPDGSSREPMTLGEAVRYHTYDDAWVPDVLAGKTSEEVGDAYESLLNSDRIKENYVRYCQVAIDAVSEFDELDRLVHLSYGDFSAHEYLQHITAFRAYRLFDFSKMLEIDVSLEDAYVQGLIDEFSPLMEMFRQVGVLGPAIEVSEDASLQTKLLAMAGRS